MLKRMLFVLALGLGLAVSPYYFTAEQYASVEAAPKIVYARDEVPSLGGIRIGSTMDYVRSVYGEPEVQKLQSKSGPFGRSYVWKYGNSFEINFAEDGTAYFISTTANNGIKTAKGIHVGQNISEAKKVYPILNKENGQYRVPIESYLCIVFKTNREGKITEIFIALAP